MDSRVGVDRSLTRPLNEDALIPRSSRCPKRDLGRSEWVPVEWSGGVPAARPFPGEPVRDESLVVAARNDYSTSIGDRTTWNSCEMRSPENDAQVCSSRCRGAPVPC